MLQTQEKWDFLTRSWRNFSGILGKFGLVMLDEVFCWISFGFYLRLACLSMFVIQIHVIGDDRGAALEVVVARMKSMQKHVRSSNVEGFPFLALIFTRLMSKDEH